MTSTMYRVTNPATGEVAEEFATNSDSEILAALDRSATAFTDWGQTPVSERAAILTRVSEIYAERAEELAEVIRLEMGKALPEGKGEVQLSSMIYSTSPTTPKHSWPMSLCVDPRMEPQ